jgi:hypothetical protein
MLIQLARRRSAESQLVPGNVIGVRVRDEANLLAACDVESQPGARKE